MEQSTNQAEAATCDGCEQVVFVLHAVRGTKLCDGCSALSSRIDQRLLNVAADDPVACDGCSEPVDFDARIAVVTRECGGCVLCDRCKPTAIEKEWIS